jgi:hypothetical protein
MPANSWKLPPGLNNVGSYQVSGKPFASGSIVAKASGSSGAIVVRFPNVTKWFQINPRCDMDPSRTLRVAFSENGLHGKGASLPLGGYNFHLNISSSLCAPMDMKVSELWFMSDDSSTYTFDVVAGLTNIPASRTDTYTSASVAGFYTVNGVQETGGTNWSGSIGVG